MSRRFFKSFEQGIEGCGGQHVHFVNDINFAFAPYRRIICARNNLFSDIINAGIGCGVYLHHIGMIARRNKLAFFAGSIRKLSGGFTAKQCFCQQTSHGCLAGSSGPAKQVGMTDLTFKHCALQSSDNMLLTDNLLECLRSILCV